MCCMFLLFVICLSSFRPNIAQSRQQTYIVHVNLPTDHVVGKSQDLDSLYHSFLPEPSRMGHKYRHVITGFAAKLFPDEVEEMEKWEGVIHVRPEKKYGLKTTYSPNFLGLYQNLGSWPGSNYGKGVIIGVIDSGIMPGHPSFDDEGVPPPPARWRGKCELKGVACNNKVIGARNFVWIDPEPPIDQDGHGTHTASIAAGNFVPSASAFGQADGTASGMSPLAHLAIYKVCHMDMCLESDVLAGMEAAVEDGVDVLSLSIAGKSTPFYDDGVAIGAFSATKKGIFVSGAANNNGPGSSTLANEAPWILTVGASTVDRQILATALLGNQDEYEGQSLQQPSNFPSTLLPLLYAGNETEAWCAPGSLDNTDVKGKVVLCIRGGGVSRTAKGQTVKDAGGAAMILMNDKPDAYSTVADVHVLPASHVSYDAGEKIKAYINSTSAPTAAILFKGTKIGGKTIAPMVASFSSRGPNLASPGILKPDIVGPGVSILAAWPESVDNFTDRKLSTFNMISGTSMACPHLSGIAALIKAAHPDWSPAMIKSAIMTSATQINLNDRPILDENYEPATVFAIGAGHVNPSKALQPGLVYDISASEYISYLCSLYTVDQVAVIVNQNINCTKSIHEGVPEAELNYPSFAIQLGYASQEYSRTVTNVGDADSTYRVRVVSVGGVNVEVEPRKLRFTKVNQRKTYKVYFSRQEFATNGSYVQGSLVWASAQHIVRIPISVQLVLTYTHNK